VGLGVGSGIGIGVGYFVPVVGATDSVGCGMGCAVG
jgi:hypothetical protein